MASELSNMVFAPFGQTFVIECSNPANTAIQVKPTGFYDDQAITQYRVHNTGTAIAYLGYATTAAAAETNANTATDLATADPADVISIAPGSVEILRLGVDTYFSGYSSPDVNVLITPGEGI